MSARQTQPRWSASTPVDADQDRATSANVGRPRRLKILFSEGSSTSARQSLYALGRLGHTIDVCDSQRFGLGRFSRYVRRWHLAPSFSADPMGYLDFVRGRLAAERYDVLLPVHDQVFLLSRFHEELSAMTGLAVPPFAALRQLQSKIEMARLFDQLGLGQPAFKIIAQASELKRRWRYPLFVKQEHGTAGRGVWRVASDEAMHMLADRLQQRGQADQPLLVQQPAHGEYRVLQGVFRHGVLVAAHAYAPRAPGVGGSAHARLAMAEPVVAKDIGRLGAQLAWHGALHIEYFQQGVSGRAEIIDANPRIGETMNATASGMNLCQALVDVSLGMPAARSAPLRLGVRTHSLLTSLLGAAEQGADRRQLLHELIQAWRRRGVYARSEDELVRPGDDPRSLIPAAVIVARLLARPGAAERIVHRAVENYGLDERGVQRIESLRQLQPESADCQPERWIRQVGVPVPA